ncbi:hypothetical protein C8R46DRAFT_1079101 [Mycena filopes]|nr:hypothetical protein C8R46DRAFT_1103045 [Mycena filopes]KAJ7175684.1 hypothetical protein C8R46DRAFT_1079101 [Mycena filopes]
MKPTSVLIFGALICSAAARPQRFGQGGFRGNRGGFGGKGAAAGKGASSAVGASSAAVAASSVVASSVAASASAVASGTAVLAANTSAPAVAAPGDLQASLDLDPSVVCASFEQDGQDPPVAGQSPALISNNNFINFCALTLPGTPLTNGLQITTGSCNPTPIGLIPSVDAMPSAKFQNPKNGATIPANTAFNAELNIQNLQTGVFTNAQKTYYSNPQTLNDKGIIIGHTHIVIESLTAIDQDTPTNPVAFVFFKGVNDAATNGLLTVPVTAGLPKGFYRMCCINSSATHQPVIVPIAQHGIVDDCSYFTTV